MSEHLRSIALKAVQAVYPTSLIKSLVKLNGDSSCILVNGKKFEIDANRGCHVVAFGKAVLGMAAELHRILGSRIKTGIVSIPIGIQLSLSKSLQHHQLLPSQSPFTVIEGAKDNLPDRAALDAAQSIRNLVKSLDSKDDLLFVLVSGGGSALLPAPTAPFSLEDKLEVIKSLSRAGATIQELNKVRICLSDLKGGKLAQLAQPARVIALILSDIIDDPLDLISSGPTVQVCRDTDPGKVAKEILTKYEIENVKVFEMLAKLETCHKVVSQDVDNVLIGSNRIALDAAQEFAKEKGFSTVSLSSKIRGEAKIVGTSFVQLAVALLESEDCQSSLDQLCVQDLDRVQIEMRQAVSALKSSGTPVCLIGGGETIVNVVGQGKGGRNQEMVLAAALAMDSSQSTSFKSFDVTFLSLGTDGIDGPTDAAGAVADQSLIGIARGEGVDHPEVFLKENNSYEFFSLVNGGQNLIKIGHTGTNVMDIQLLLITPK